MKFHPLARLFGTVQAKHRDDARQSRSRFDWTKFAARALLVSAAYLVGPQAIGRATQATPLEEIAARARPVVATLELLDSNDRVVGSGTGFLISLQELVTNWHVAAGAERIQAHFGWVRPIEIAAVLAESESLDLVILQIGADDSLALFSDSGVRRRPLALEIELPKQGVSIAVLGSPRGLGSTLSTGIVSSLRELDGRRTLIQITAPISPGSSGSPLLDAKGDVLGVATLSLDKSQNINFAVPSATLSKLPRHAPVSFAVWTAAIPKERVPAPTSDSKASAPTFAGLKSIVLGELERGLQRDIAGRLEKRLDRFPLLSPGASEVERWKRDFDIGLAEREQLENEARASRAIDHLRRCVDIPIASVAIEHGEPVLLDHVTFLAFLCQKWIGGTELQSRRTQAFDLAFREPDSAPAWRLASLLAITDASYSFVGCHIYALAMAHVADPMENDGWLLAVSRYGDGIFAADAIECGVNTGVEFEGQDVLVFVDRLRVTPIYVDLPETFSLEAAASEWLAASLTPQVPNRPGSDGVRGLSGRPLTPDVIALLRRAAEARERHVRLLDQREARLSDLPWGRRMALSPGLRNTAADAARARSALALTLKSLGEHGRAIEVLQQNARAAELALSKLKEEIKADTFGMYRNDPSFRDGQLRSAYGQCLAAFVECGFGSLDGGQPDAARAELVRYSELKRIRDAIPAPPVEFNMLDELTSKRAEELNARLAEQAVEKH